MSGRMLCSVLLIFVGCGTIGFAQTSATAKPGVAHVDPVARRLQARVSGTACWKQAGMTPDMVNQRWKIEDQQKTEIAQVCNEPSTSPQQKHDRIEQIHAETDHAIAQLIPSRELSAFNRCQAELESSRPKPAGQKELGPCGGAIPASKSAEPADSAPHRHAKAPATP